MSSLLVVTPPGEHCDALCASLTESGFSVLAAGSGGEAVAQARQHVPDAIVVDPSLSAMDRWHAVKRLNVDPKTGNIPVLTLPSDSASAEGLARLVEKIHETIQNPTGFHTSGRASGAKKASGAVASVSVAPMAARDETHQGKPLVLVVDDNALNRDMLARRLTRRGFRVETASDGPSTLDLVTETTPDLVLLDWMMPGISGIEVLGQLRERFSPMELPVIMATAKTEAEDVVEALQEGANDYVVKPVHFDVVDARIRTQLNLRQAHRELAASERRYRALLENTGDMIIQFLEDGRIIYVSQACRTLLGFEGDELVDKNLFDYLHPLDRRELERQQADRPALPPAFTFITRMQRKDQTYIWVETSCRLVRSGDVRIQAACRDVSEHMERLAGDEPPLPLGGDIMAHPGWRVGLNSEELEADNGMQVSLEGGLSKAQDDQSVPVVLLTMLDGGTLSKQSASSKSEVIAALRKQLDALLGE